MWRIYKSKIVWLKKNWRLKEVKDYLLFTCYDASDIDNLLKEKGFRRSDVIIEKTF